MKLEIVQETTYIGEVYTQRTKAATTKTPATPATTKAPTPAAGDELRAAFIALLAAVDPETQQTIVAELHRPRRPRRMLDTSPAALAQARQLFSF